MESESGRQHSVHSLEIYRRKRGGKEIDHTHLFNSII